MIVLAKVICVPMSCRFAYLVCNQLPPVGDQPSLLSFREVETLFHEFGHGIQHMLTQVGDAAVAGISGVEWDAVELPSQFMEQFFGASTSLGFGQRSLANGRTVSGGLVETAFSGSDLYGRHGYLTAGAFCFA